MPNNCALQSSSLEDLTSDFPTEILRSCLELSPCILGFSRTLSFVYAAFPAAQITITISSHLSCKSLSPHESRQSRRVSNHSIINSKTSLLNSAISSFPRKIRGCREGPQVVCQLNLSDRRISADQELSCDASKHVTGSWCCDSKTVTADYRSWIIILLARCENLTLGLAPPGQLSRQSAKLALLVAGFSTGSDGQSHLGPSVNLPVLPIIIETARKRKRRLQPNPSSSKFEFA